MSKGELQPWFIISVKTRHEFIAQKYLNTLNIDVYLPIYRKKFKIKKEKIEALSPLFSGYLFARFNIEESYHKVRYTKGVRAVLGNTDCLYTISDERIHDIRSREEGGIVILRSRDPHFKKGDRIIIDEGDFDGWEGIFFEELADRERAVIMLTNISYSSKLIIPKNILMKK
jgi:transcriptional antiterminator RfaH